MQTADLSLSLVVLTLSVDTTTTGICAISTADDGPLVLATSEAGQEGAPGVPVQIHCYEVSGIVSTSICAHPTSYRLVQVALNRTGDKVATASENV
jgi:hypothetical protein